MYMNDTSSIKGLHTSLCLQEGRVRGLPEDQLVGLVVVVYGLNSSTFSNLARTYHFLNIFFDSGTGLGVNLYAC